MLKIYLNHTDLMNTTMNDTFDEVEVGDQDDDQYLTELGKQAIFFCFIPIIYFLTTLSIYRKLRQIILIMIKI